MKLHISPATPAASPVDETDAGGTYLHGRRLVAARVTWVLLVTWMLTNFALSLPGQFHLFAHPSTRSTELAPTAVAALHQIGISPEAYAWIAVSFGSLIMLVATTLAFVLFWRRGHIWMVLLISLFFPAYCLLSIGPSESFTAAPSGSPLAVGNTLLLGIITFGIIYAVFVLFPSGRFVPSWSWALLAACVAWVAARTAAPTLAVLFMGYPIFLGAAIASQIHRYRKVSTSVQRQQTRWAVFGLVSALLANQAFWLPSGFTPLGKTIYPAVAYLVLYGSVLLIPVTFFIAIRRYRLYEIDVIIRGTLIYGTLTVVLAGLYFVMVLSIQALARNLTGMAGQQQPVIVVTTLLIAALFAPLRQRIQSGIDRAFYRSKYDAAVTVAQFGARLRMETDLEELSDHVVEVVQQTMRPTHATLWLRSSDHRPTDPAKHGEPH